MATFRLLYRLALTTDEIREQREKRAANAEGILLQQQSQAAHQDRGGAENGRLIQGHGRFRQRRKLGQF